MSTIDCCASTPCGVAQQSMVDITTNNYQKAIESFFSKYCSYALTIFFAELKGVKKFEPNADTRQALVNAGLSQEAFGDDGVVNIDFEELAINYFVRTVPGSLVELEDEKQLRILNSLFVPPSAGMAWLSGTNSELRIRSCFSSSSSTSEPGTVRTK